jgi:hypothetical protein
MADGRLAEERVSIVSAFCDSEALAKHAPDIRALAAHLANSMNQECIALEIEGALEFHEQSGEGDCVC